MSFRFLGVVALACHYVVATGCDGTISVTFATGPQIFDVSIDDLVPAELKDGSSETIAAVGCGPMGMCPSSSPATLTCEGGVCDPAPKTLSGPVGEVIDVEDLLVETREIGLRTVDSYDVEEVGYHIQLNTLTAPTSEVEVWWGPEAASAFDEALGARRFGTLPAIGPGETRAGQLDVDPAGEATLVEYLMEGGCCVRLFTRSVVDLDPGDPFPRGAARVAVNVRLRAVGSVVD